MMQKIETFQQIKEKRLPEKNKWGFYGSKKKETFLELQTTLPPPTYIVQILR